MSSDDGERPEGIDGLPLDDAVDVVVDREESATDAEARRALSYLTDDDGVVTAEAVDSALGELSKVVSTPETRTELAEIALDDAREAAEPVADLDVVAARLDRYEERLDEIRAHVPTLGDELRRLVDDDASLYDLAVGIHDLTVAANSAQEAADRLQVELEEFERWVGNQTVRFDDLAEEVDALADSVDELADVVDTVAAAADDDRVAALDADPAAAWVDTAFRHRVVSLLFEDLRTELDGLRAWPDAETPERAADIADRIDDLEARWESVGDALDDAARPEWRERFDEDLTAFDSALAVFEPPLDWNAVQATLDDYRSRIDGLS
jgi:hypothetical protein